MIISQFGRMREEGAGMPEKTLEHMTAVTRLQVAENYRHARELQQFRPGALVLGSMVFGAGLFGLGLLVVGLIGAT